MSGYRIPGPLGCRPEQESIDRGTSCLARTPPPGPVGLHEWGAGSPSFLQFERIGAVNRALDRSQAIYLTRLTAIFAGIDISPIVDGLWETVKQAALVLGGFTAVGAAAGALVGGVGVIPGAVAGVGVGILVLNLMGLEELISEIPQQIEAIVEPYRAGFALAWRAGGAPPHETAAIEDAASEFAAGHIALSLAVLAAIIAYAARGKGKPLKEILEKSRLRNAAEWLEKNAPRLKERLEARTRGSGAQPSSGSPQGQATGSRPLQEARRGAPVVEKKAPPRKRLAETDVPCFNPYDRPGFQAMTSAQQRKFLENYAKQLRRQQDAINSMTAGEFKAARQLFNSVGRGGAQSAQNEARHQFEQMLRDRIRDSLLSRVPPGVAVDRDKLLDLAEARAAEIMRDLDVLHIPDMVAGGSEVPVQMGDRSVNRAIGGSWTNRMDELDSAANGGVARGDGDALMNVKLEVCRGRLP